MDIHLYIVTLSKSTPNKKKLSLKQPVDLRAFLHLNGDMLPRIGAGADALFTRFTQLRAQFRQTLRVVVLRLYPGTNHTNIITAKIRLSVCVYVCFSFTPQPLNQFDWKLWWRKITGLKQGLFFIKKSFTLVFCFVF